MMRRRLISFKKKVISYVEGLLDWMAASAPGANDGYLRLWVDTAAPTTSNEATELVGVDNDTLRLEGVGLGSLYGTYSGSSGTFYMDNWTANNDGAAIGA